MKQFLKPIKALTEIYPLDLEKAFTEEFCLFSPLFADKKLRLK